MASTKLIALVSLLEHALSPEGPNVGLAAIELWQYRALMVVIGTKFHGSSRDLRPRDGGSWEARSQSVQSTQARDTVLQVAICYACILKDDVVGKDWWLVVTRIRDTLAVLTSRDAAQRASGHGRVALCQGSTRAGQLDNGKRLGHPVWFMKK